jgi:hypothetical protein
VNLSQLNAVETGALKRDGTNSPSANIPWNGKKITGLADGDDPQDAATVSQIPILTNYLKRDGSNSPSANIPWNGKKITGLADGDDPQDAATIAQVNALGDVANLTTSETDTNKILQPDGLGSVAWAELPGEIILTGGLTQDGALHSLIEVQGVSHGSSGDTYVFGSKELQQTNGCPRVSVNFSGEFSYSWTVNDTPTINNVSISLHRVRGGVDTVIYSVDMKNYSIEYDTKRIGVNLSFSWIFDDSQDDDSYYVECFFDYTFVYTITSSWRYGTFFIHKT